MRKKTEKANETRHEFAVETVGVVLVDATSHPYSVAGLAVVAPATAAAAAAAAAGIVVAD